MIIDKPVLSMWRLIEKKGTPPLRMSRYCCSELKETKGKGRIVVTGVRWAESIRRKTNRNLIDIGAFKKQTAFNDDNNESRRAVENCYRTQTTLLNPIIDWSDEDVWEFINKQNVRYCSLYDEGWNRLGCIGCPMAGYEGMKRDFERWPKYKQLYIHAFDRMIASRKTRGKTTNKFMQSGQDCFDWWIGNAESTDDTMDGQIDMDEL